MKNLRNILFLDLGRRLKKAQGWNLFRILCYLCNHNQTYTHYEIRRNARNIRPARTL